jgi:hypothetical protein
MITRQYWWGKAAALAIGLLASAAASPGDAAFGGLFGNDDPNYVGPQNACVIDPRKELVITDLLVVENHRAQGMGPWSFGKLMGDMAPEGVSGERFVETFFDVWIESALNDPTDFLNIDGAANPSSEAASIRADNIAAFLESWPRLGNGDLDLAQAPLRLTAIVNRLDLGEGRFVFVFVDESGMALDCTIIVEYKLPPVGPDGEQQPLDWWAQEWHRLSGMRMGSAPYMSQLEKLTDRFASRNIAPDWPNGSAIGQIRVNEQLSDSSPGGLGLEVVPVWQLREFHLDPETGLMDISTVKGNPHLDYNTFHQDEDHPNMCIETLTDYLLENKDDLLSGRFVYDPSSIQEGVTAPLRGQAFSWLQEQPVPIDMSEDEWDKVRKAFSRTTCNGCHGADDGYWIEFPNAIDHAFTHISMREEGEQATISQYLKDDLRDVRIPNMLSYVCPGDPRAKRASALFRPVH